MGGKNSIEERPIYCSSSSIGGSHYGGVPQPDSQQQVQEAYLQSYPAVVPNTSGLRPPQEKAGQMNQPHKKLDRRYSRIVDDYSSLEQDDVILLLCWVVACVSEALARAGLESSYLIVGIIDFTKSNEWTGSKSFNRKSLHHIGDYSNPYEQAIAITGKTLATFDEDNLIPVFGFGDGLRFCYQPATSTHDQDVFSFYPEERFCKGFDFEDVLSRYREIVPQLKLAGIRFNSSVHCIFCHQCKQFL
ncbi:hypothetical protein CTI12_AA389640 [Artemisia annua]|uniref:Copine C-terminal domain-containing protein n=1 Tax=Artemisia annua TaxID=35608 RepID=A0A2U1MEK9_ARTAN|nr:hypothetical protein CTI12_AA389640 [Artemisia annua]